MTDSVAQANKELALAVWGRDLNRRLETDSPEFAEQAAYYGAGFFAKERVAAN